MQYKSIEEKFRSLGVDNAPGQEKLQKEEKLELKGDPIIGDPVDFSHGDVDAHEPIPGSREKMLEGIDAGGKQAYTEYRGAKNIREYLAGKLSQFTNTKIDVHTELILTPGTQGALFLAMGAFVAKGDKVAIVEPDYFANRKMVEFLEGEMVPIPMNYLETEDGAGIDLNALEDAFKNGVKVFLFSNPNNPVGNIYSDREITEIGRLAKKYKVSVIVDQLYSRQIFDHRKYVHLCAKEERPEQMITIIGPSKTESLSGYRLGTAFGTPEIINRMEKLQAIVSLRTGGYNQAVYKAWFDEPEGWMEERIDQHQSIRDVLVKKFEDAGGFTLRKTEGGSYLFVQCPELEVDILTFVKILRKYAGVTVTPGTEFGPQFTNHFRINFSQDKEKAMQAVYRIIEMVERYKK